MGTVIKLLLKVAGKLVKWSSIFILLLAIATISVIWSSGDSHFKPQPLHPMVTDVTQLNPVVVAQVIAPVTLDEVVAAVKHSTGPISIGGGRYSQGGQVSYPDSLHLDMRQFNQVLNLDPDTKEVTVQPGITWRALQEVIDPHDLAIRIMQTYANFTVGGSISVNAHGRYIGEGPLAHSVKSIKLVLADGTVVSASREENPALFFAAVGGYGGLGVLVEATLWLTDNHKVERQQQKMPLADYKDYFFSTLRDDKTLVFHNADIYPPAFTQVRSVSWFKTDKAVTVPERLIPEDQDYYWTPKVAGWVADYDTGKWLRENLVDPLVYASEAVEWRNYEASYSVLELEPSDRKAVTYALREYFVPVQALNEFSARMAEIFQRHQVNIINVSIRHAKADPGTLLAWAKGETFALVVYYQQGTDRQAMAQVKAWSREMIDAVIAVGGSYYLPYQIYADEAQFLAAYPRAPEFFALKQQVDPDYRFRNSLWRQHYPGELMRGNQQARFPQYQRAEEQTLLTIPEWYLVFNPREYADFLAAGQAPSDFPFMASIDRYWTLYDRVLALTQDKYPHNEEYLTMLQVIGISTTVEYLLKSAYEQSIGRFSAWTANGQTQEDVVIAQAHRAYSELIFDKAWYEFDFAYWVGKIWQDSDFFGENFIRKLERKLAFSLEFGFKQGYAALIGYAATVTYEPAEGLVYLSAIVPDTARLPAQVQVLHQNAQASILALPRWGEFSRLIPELAGQGVRFLDISGNKGLSLSVLQPMAEKQELTHAVTLFGLPMVTAQGMQQRYLWVQVEQLHALLQELEDKQIRLEHIYDF
ncbi:FAD-binding oxidoreductase [Bowmanella sp. Y26]|uniref:FAD-binding oxidoreductase n=1 Tax=Bowmanella yangjiangensis TaxID=2811230 RepID=UPI001BDBEB49|nr:FAD-binding oxidoreductase [Bowmanella yangjiangensis]MBT1065464.1 FAD-binding oxidoreductase [Bowmanella yangjiangensis]